MASYTYTAALDAVTLVTQTGTVGEKFQHTMKLAAGASDINLAIGAITVPKYLIVVGAEGVSFKLDAGGTDAIGAYPIAVVTDEDGMTLSAILLSNSGAQEAEVTVYAGE
jgi:hypothetical protein